MPFRDDTLARALRRADVASELGQAEARAEELRRELDRIDTGPERWRIAVIACVGGVLTLLLAGVSVFLQAVLSMSPPNHGLPPSNAQKLRVGAEAMLAVRGACPTTFELVREGLSPHDVYDPWDRPYEIVCTEDGVHVTSGGPDRRMGTRDDVVVEAP